eukprot:1678870-Rhodomonas_salina.1
MGHAARVRDLQEGRAGKGRRSREWRAVACGANRVCMRSSLRRGGCAGQRHGCWEDAGSGLTLCECEWSESMSERADSHYNQCRVLPCGSSMCRCTDVCVTCRHAATLSVQMPCTCTLAVFGQTVYGLGFRV